MAKQATRYPTYDVLEGGMSAPVSSRMRAFRAADLEHHPLREVYCCIPRLSHPPPGESLFGWTIDYRLSESCAGVYLLVGARGGLPAALGPIFNTLPCFPWPCVNISESPSISRPTVRWRAGFSTGWQCLGFSKRITAKSLSSLPTLTFPFKTKSRDS